MQTARRFCIVWLEVAQFIFFYVHHVLAMIGDGYEVNNNRDAGNINSITTEHWPGVWPWRRAETLSIILAYIAVAAFPHTRQRSHEAHYLVVILQLVHEAGIRQDFFRGVPVRLTLPVSTRHVVRSCDNETFSVSQS